VDWDALKQGDEIRDLLTSDSSESKHKGSEEVWKPEGNSRSPTGEEESLDTGELSSKDTSERKEWGERAGEAGEMEDQEPRRLRGRGGILDGRGVVTDTMVTDKIIDIIVLLEKR
jgi:hypothetical protein